MDTVRKIAARAAHVSSKASFNTVIWHSNGTATTVPKRMATTALLVTLAAAIISMAD
jgi:hypothetical protein